ncbi:hypothetical protein [Streptomyces sp. NPDC051662]
MTGVSEGADWGAGDHQEAPHLGRLVRREAWRARRDPTSRRERIFW